MVVTLYKIKDRESPEFGRWVASVQSLQGTIPTWGDTPMEALEELAQKTGLKQFQDKECMLHNGIHKTCTGCNLAPVAEYIALVKARFTESLESPYTFHRGKPGSS